MFNRDLRPPLNIHDKVDRFLDKNFHYNYQAIHHALWTDNFIRQGIRDLHLISMPPKLSPLLVSAAENSRTAREIVENDFVSIACGEISDSNQNLVASLRLALEKADFPPGNTWNVNTRADCSLLDRAFVGSVDLLFFCLEKRQNWSFYFLF